MCSSLGKGVILFGVREILNEDVRVDEQEERLAAKVQKTRGIQNAAPSF